MHLWSISTDHSGTCIISLWLPAGDKEDESLQRFFFKKKAALLLCTDIAAHGLDFPALHWMIQLDCSEDANAYIHWMNVNTHIRFDEGNHPMHCKKICNAYIHWAIEVQLDTKKVKRLSSEEVDILKALQTNHYDSNPDQSQENGPNSEMFCIQDLETKHWAQRSFIC